MVLVIKMYLRGLKNVSEIKDSFSHSNRLVQSVSGNGNKVVHLVSLKSLGSN